MPSANNWGNFMTFYYFAYGSNMLTTRLRPRCPSARLIGHAEALDYRIEFSKKSIDTSGKATLLRREGSDHFTGGVLFEIDKAELPNLDKAEGVGYGYKRHDEFPIRLEQDAKTMNAVTYLATEVDVSLKPFDWYLALVIAGALEHGLADEHITQLREVDFEVDSDLDRPSRKTAIQALNDHGLREYKSLFKTN
jgi:hypothetical protein